jgi:hypothetical protein
MMGVIELLGVAASISLLSGWRFYLCVFATGLAMRCGWLPTPEQIPALDVLASPWVIAAAGVGLIAEFFADKIPWIDSTWDSIHGVVRVLGGALLALAIVDAGDPAWQVAVFLLGGAGALLSHGAKVNTRLAVNASPEPVSNIAVSTGEDVAATGLIALALANPVAAIVIAVLLAVLCVVVILMIRRLLARLFRLFRRR